MMARLSRRTSAGWCALVLLTAGAGGCTWEGSGGGGPEVSAPVTPPFPPEEQRVALAWAAQQGQAPADGRTSAVAWGNGDAPDLIWQAGRTGEVCLARILPAAVTTVCQQASIVLAAPSPGVQTVFSKALNSRGGWNVLLMSSGETVDEISCGQQAFKVHGVLETETAGVARRFYSVAVPGDIGGTFGVTARRTGQPAVDSVQIITETGKTTC